MSVKKSIWTLESDRQRNIAYAAGGGGTITVFDVSHDSVRSQHRISSGWINGLSYSDTTNTLVAATSRGVLLNIDADSFSVRTSLTTNYWLNGIKRVRTGMFESYIVTTAEGFILLWDISSNKLHAFPKHHSDQVWACSVSDSGEFVITGG